MKRKDLIKKLQFPDAFLSGVAAIMIYTRTPPLAGNNLFHAIAK